MHIPNFEQRIRHMRSIVKNHPMDEDMSTYSTKEITKEFKDIQQALLKKPILKRMNAAKRIYLKTDFSKLGMGYVIYQTGDDKESIEAMKPENAGGKGDLDLTVKGLQLFPCGFGSRCNSGHESWIHFYIDEAKGFRWAVLKNQHIF